MKNRTPLAVAAIALLSLAACKNEPQEVSSTAPDPQASQLANAAPVELPPAITDSVSLRCADNSLIFVDFFDGNKMVQVKTEKTGTGTILKAPEAGEPFVAEGGYELTGTPKSVTVTLPGKPAKTCKA